MSRLAGHGTSSQGTAAGEALAGCAALVHLDELTVGYNGTPVLGRVSLSIIAGV